MSAQGKRGPAMLAVLKRPRLLSLAQKLFALLLIMVCGTQLAHAERKTTYYHTDGLGSVVAASDQNGALLWRKEYTPFGEQRDSTAENEKLAYTGKEHDDSTGLTYFGARYYDPQLGRFMSVDPVGFVESNPMSFNRYAYASNNPFRFVDPDGREAVGAAWLQQTGAFFGAMPAPRNKTEAGLALAGVALPFAAATGVVAVHAAIAGLANPAITLAITEAVLGGEALGGGTLIAGGAAVTAAKGAVTEIANVTAAGSRYTNIAAKLTSQEFQSNLMSNGYKVIRQAPGSNGPVTILGNGSKTYTIYTATSTGAASAQATDAAGEILSKIRLSP